MEYFHCTYSTAFHLNVKPTRRHTLHLRHHDTLNPQIRKSASDNATSERDVAGCNLHILLAVRHPHQEPKPVVL